MHGPGHDHHDHHDHAGPARSADRQRRLVVALVLNGVIVAGQLAFGVAARSLGLLADAGHNLADVGGVAMALIAVRLARRAPSRRRSFGLHRATVLAAQANAAVMVVTSSIVTFEGIRRLTSPGEVDGGVVVVIALVAMVANLAAAGLLRHHHGDLNLRAAMLHLLGDGVASAGVAASGLVIWQTDGWYWLDPAISLVIAAFIAWRAVSLLRETADLLLQSTPAHLDIDAIAHELSGIDGVVDVHDLHVWALTHDMEVASAHVMVAAGTDTHRVLDQARHVLADRYRLTHATLQVEPDDHTGCEELTW